MGWARHVVIALVLEQKQKGKRDTKENKAEDASKWKEDKNGDALPCGTSSRNSAEETTGYDEQRTAGKREQKKKQRKRKTDRGNRKASEGTPEKQVMRLPQSAGTPATLRCDASGRCTCDELPVVSTNWSRAAA